MARYFMSGTRYESFERMMMSPDRRGKGKDTNDSSPTNDYTRDHVPQKEVAE